MWPITAKCAWWRARALCGSRIASGRPSQADQRGRECRELATGWLQGAGEVGLMSGSRWSMMPRSCAFGSRTAQIGRSSLLRPVRIRCSITVVARSRRTCSHEEPSLALLHSRMNSSDDARVASTVKCAPRSTGAPGGDEQLSEDRDGVGLCSRVYRPSNCVS